MQRTHFLNRNCLKTTEAQIDSISGSLKPSEMRRCWVFYWRSFFPSSLSPTNGTYVEGVHRRIEFAELFERQKRWAHQFPSLFPSRILSERLLFSRPLNWFKNNHSIEIVLLMDQRMAGEMQQSQISEPRCLTSSAEKSTCLVFKLSQLLPCGTWKLLDEASWKWERKRKE